MALKTRYSLLNQINLQNLANTFLTLSPRDRLFSMGAGVLIAVLLVFLPISLLSSKIHSLQSEVGSSQEILQKIVIDLQEYKDLDREVSQMKRQVGSGIPNIMSHIEDLANQSNVKPNMESLNMAPSIDTDFFEGDVVSLRLRRLTLAQLVDFLYHVEHGKQGLLKVNRIEIKPAFSNRALLDVSAEIAALRFKEGL